MILPNDPSTPNETRRIAIVVKGYPRLSETFIAQEILALEERGLTFDIWSLRQPTEQVLHPMHRRIRARVTYLPEYLYQAPLRVLRGALWSMRQPSFRRLLAAFWRDALRDPTANRGRRLGQAFVMARELPAEVRHLHVHYLHTPASVVRYAAILRGLSWTFSAHAKDIWTTPDWEKREKLAEAAWGVTCTAQGVKHLAPLAPTPGHVSLIYHGLDLSRFPEPRADRPTRDGADPADPVRIVSVGRVVAKKGYGDLLRALAALPRDLHWRFVHVGGGQNLADLKRQAKRLGLGPRCAFLGPKSQTDVIALLREADLFVLPSKKAKSGDQDGLPNVILEAASQGLMVVATDFAGIPEFIRADQEGVLVPPGDWEALSNALNVACRDPTLRARLGAVAYERLLGSFSIKAGIDELERRLRTTLDLLAPVRP